MIRVVIADDHPVFLSGLVTAFAGVPDIEVVGSVTDGRAAVDAVRSLHPDVVLMDLRMSPMNGIDATREVVRERLDAAVLVLTMFDDDESVFTAMAAGARGYLVKGSPQERIIDAVRAVASGDVVFGQAVAERVLSYFSQATATSRAAAFPMLTTREAGVLELMAEGRANANIANALGLSEKTVRNNVSSIFAKLRVADRSEAIVRAREAGLGGGVTSGGGQLQ